MLSRIRLSGVVGIVSMLAGVAVVALENPIVAVGLAMILSGLAVIIAGVVSRLRRALASPLGGMGMGGMDVDVDPEDFVPEDGEFEEPIDEEN
ncbi:hypothetical protein BRD17_07950 [Halobacteriales archaeon SW_7_68_16]|nr:MAG: hypothetical protein BRD17_07950 [Halobacteriales archaeon SW_7_68_16]